MDCCESKLLNRWKITVHSRLPQLSIEGVEHNLSPRQLALYALFQQIAARAYSQCGGQLAMDLFVKALRTAHLTGQVSALVQATNNALGPGGFEFVSRVNFSEPTCLTLLQAWLAAAPLEQPEREQSREHIVALVG